MLPKLYLVAACIDCPACGLHDEDVLGQLTPLAIRHERRRRGHRVEISALRRAA